MNDMFPTSHADLSDAEFRSALRQFLAAHYPPLLRQPLTLRLRHEALTDWLRTLLAHGWRAPAWPREYGGMGLDLRRQLIYHDEMQRHGVARMLDIGETLLGPVLMRYGTEAQRDRYLPRILSCEDQWAQGYSEPNAGSDLASLRTSAVRDGDAFIVNGQKTWSTHAPEATHIFVLVRTATMQRKQQGISFLLIDRNTLGITVRPIVNLLGEQEFAEIFFDDVRVPADNLVGTLNDGWSIAKSLLGFERVSVGNPVLARLALAELMRLCDSQGRRDDPLFADRLARAACDLHDTQALYEEVCEDWIANKAPLSETSMLKVLSTELFQRISELLVDFMHEAGAAGEPVTESGVTLDPNVIHLLSRPPTIYAGASEVQRNILAKSVIGDR